MIDQRRIKHLNNKEVIDAGPVVYWMQQSQRTNFNHGLEYSIIKANQLKKPVVVYFGLTDSFPEANLRHYMFMLEGLKEVESSLKQRNIKFVIEKKSPEKGIVEFIKNPSLVVTDRGYLKIQKKWRKYAADKFNCSFVEVESDVIVPVEEASLKEEYAAYTIRKKINSRVSSFLIPLNEEHPQISSMDFHYDNILDLSNLDELISTMDLNELPPSKKFKGGFKEADSFLDDFMENKLPGYDVKRNDPALDYTSNLSPYLHFGQISPVYIALKLKDKKGDGVDAFLEEMIVRRELSMNFINYNDYYDSFECLPDWAKSTLRAHKNDLRPYLYSLEEFENGKTHDRYWNAAQMEQVKTGKMHGYMRMYWGKKIIEWSKSPEMAFQTALFLNNKYSLDGRDPNAFTGVAWCFGKHDRPWKEREIFGKIRYMNAGGLKRKFNPDHYVDIVNSL